MSGTETGSDRTILWSVAGLFFLAVTWGYSWVFLKLALDDSGPMTFAGMRTMFAGIFLLGLLPLLGRSMKPTRVAETATLGFIQTTGFVGLTMLALVNGGAGRTSILVFTMPFWTLILARIFLHEKMEGLQRVAIVVAAIGLWVILQPGAMGGQMISGLLAAGAGVVWAISSVFTKQMHLRGAFDLISVSAWQMIMGSCVLIVVAMVIGEPPVRWTTQFIMCLTVTAIISTGLSWVVWSYVLEHLSASVAGLCMLGVPVIALTSASFHLGEVPAVSDWIGMGLITAAMLLLSVHGWRNGRREARVAM